MNLDLFGLGIVVAATTVIAFGVRRRYRQVFRIHTDRHATHKGNNVSLRAMIFLIVFAFVVKDVIHEQVHDAVSGNASKRLDRVFLQ